jgi:hypothetical protein
LEVLEMAICLGDRNEVIKVISSKDEAVTCGLEDYREYLLTLDEKILELKPDVKPTVFHLKKVLTAEESNFVEAKKLGTSKDGTPTVQLGFIPEAVRQALIKVEQPEGVDFNEKVHPKTGKYSEEFVSLLNQVGIASELYTARENALNGTTGSTVMKKK